MIDSELALLSKAIQDGALERLVSFGIEPDHFGDSECREVYETCLEHVRLWRVSPSVDAVRRQHPDFKLRVTTDALDYLADEFVRSVSYRCAVEKWRELATSIDDRSQQGRLPELFAEHAREMATLVPTPRSSRHSDMARRIVIARKEQQIGILPGITLGYQGIDYYTKTIRDTEMVCFCAWQGVGKSTALVRAAFNAYRQGRTPMFVSLEMEGEEIHEIFDAMHAKLSETAVRARELTPSDYERWERAAREAAQWKQDIIVIDDLRGAGTVDRVAALAERYQPGLVCVDYLSLMEAHRDIRNDWERVTYISRALKRLARSFKIPLYAAAQSNRMAEREGPSLDNLAYAVAPGQDSNVVIGLHQTPELARMKKMEIRLLKNRKGQKCSYFELWDRDMMHFEPWRAEHEWGLRTNGARSSDDAPVSDSTSRIRLDAFEQGVSDKRFTRETKK